MGVVPRQNKTILVSVLARAQERGRIKHVLAKCIPYSINGPVKFIMSHGDKSSIFTLQYSSLVLKFQSAETHTLGSVIPNNCYGELIDITNICLKSILCKILNSEP